MEKLFEIQKIILSQFNINSLYHREIFKSIKLNNRITGVVGSRGVGKTTFLLYTALQAGAQKQKSLYVSADHLYFLENKIIDLVDQLYKETDVRLLCIDEIHKYANWRQELKNIFDIYRDFKILFSGSSTIDILHGKYDLSRRVTLYTLHGFSFREFLESSLKKKLPIISLSDLIEKHHAFAYELDLPQILKYFKEYLKLGYYPFFEELPEEREKFQAIENAVQKTIYEDIAVLHSLKTPTLMLIEKLYKFVINSQPGELSVFKLANILGKDFESIGEYLKLLEHAGLVRGIYPNKTGKSFLKNPLKMYPDNSNLIYTAYLPLLEDSVIGKTRETFVVNQLHNTEQAVYYSEIGDFKVNDYIFEIGGKNKTTKQIKEQKNAFVLADGILLGRNNIIPLFLVGFLY